MLQFTTRKSHYKFTKSKFRVGYNNKWCSTVHVNLKWGEQTKQVQCQIPHLTLDLSLFTISFFFFFFIKPSISFMIF